MKKRKEKIRKDEKINDLMSRWENAMMKKINSKVRGRYNEADLETDETCVYALRMSVYDGCWGSEGVERRVKSFMKTGKRRDEGG